MGRLVAPLLTAVALVVAACGADEEATETVTETDTVTETETVTEPPEEQPAPEGPEPVGELALDARQTDDFPTGGGEVAYLVDVRAASHEATAEHPAFDRVVLEFDGADPPSWRVTYVEPPVQEDGSGREVEVGGQAFLELRLSPATGVDLTGAEPEETYTGPTRIELGGRSVLEIVRIGDFEANLAWVAGVRGQAGFAAELFEEPLRLVVDVAAPGGAR